MRITRVDKKEGLIEAVPDGLDDLWHLEKIIYKGDTVKGHSTRRHKTESGAERKKVFVELEVEKTELDLVGHRLRITGIILSGRPEEYIEMKAHHTLEIAPREKLCLKKKTLGKWVVDRLEKAKKASLAPKMVLMVLDDERADIAMLTQRGLEKVCVIESGKAGKRLKVKEGKEKYFQEIEEKLLQLGLAVIIAGPGFTREELEKRLREKKSRVEASFTRVSSTGPTGLNELLKKKSVEKLLKQSVVAEEAQAMERVMAELGKDGLVNYGLEEARTAVEAGAVEELIVLDEFFAENREKTEKLLEKAEKSGARTRLIGSGEAGKKLEALGGIACLLRYRLN